MPFAKLLLILEQDYLFKAVGLRGAVSRDERRYTVHFPGLAIEEGEGGKLHLTVSAPDRLRVDK